MLLDDFCYRGLYRFLRRHICIVCRNFRNSGTCQPCKRYKRRGPYLSAPGFSRMNDATSSSACLAASSSVFIQQEVSRAIHWRLTIEIDNCNISSAYDHCLTHHLEESACLIPKARGNLLDPDLLPHLSRHRLGPQERRMQVYA
jgi:hypothetical protein